MPKSKLESYEDILEGLVDKPLTFEHITRESNIDSTKIKQQIEFLMKNDLVEERVSVKKTSYAITERGVAVLRALNFQRYLGKIKNTLRAIDEAMEIIPNISKHNRSCEEKSED